MKKSLALCVGLLFVFSSYSASAQITVNKISGKTVSADISISPEYERNFAAAVIMPYGADEDNIKIENGTIKNTFYISKETDADGNVTLEFTLPDGFENGQYTIVSYDSGKKYVSRIGISDGGFDSDLALVNGAESASELKNAVENFEHFNIDNEIFSTHGEKICGYVFAEKTNYTKDEFIKAYFTAEALSRYGAKEISFYEFLTEYTAYLGIDFKNTFGTLSENGFDEADKLFSAKLQNIGLDLSETLLNIFEIAEIKACKTAEDISKAYLANAVSRKVDMTDFNKLDSYNKESLFLEMISKISDTDTLSEIDSVFLSLANGLANPTYEKPSSGGGSSNKVSSGVSANVQPILPDSAKSDFSDISEHWAKDYIKALAGDGIINGFSDNTFKPDNSITRAEFTKIACKAFGINGGADCGFSDVSASDWFYESVCSAKSAGIITGYDGIFNPNGFITREDASVIINRILNLSADKNAVFSDTDEISDYAVQAVNALCENKILSGYTDSTFKPKGNITRAETAAVIARTKK